MNKNHIAAYALDHTLTGFDLDELVQPPLSQPRVRFRNLAVTDDVLRAKLLAAVDSVLRNGQLVMGEEVQKLERKIADFCGMSHCIGVASGTSAILIALAAFGVGPGDEVITTPMSALGSSNAIAALGAVPVFVDVREDLNLDPNRVEEAITSKTKAILPVHYTGRLCDMDRLMAIGKKHGVPVIEDASQAWGAENHLGRAAGIGDAGAISVSQMKILNSYGEAGVVLVDDAAIAEKMVSLRYLGSVNREVCVVPHINHKIDTIQAAMMLAAFDQAEISIRRRLEIARRYNDGLSAYVKCPRPLQTANDRSCVFFDYTISTAKRAPLRLWLQNKGVEVKIRHPLTLADQPCYRHLPKRDLPVASRMVHEILSLPIHEKMTDDDVDYVIGSLASYFGNSGV